MAFFSRDICSSAIPFVYTSQLFNEGDKASELADLLFARIGPFLYSRVDHKILDLCRVTIEKTPLASPDRKKAIIEYYKTATRLVEDFFWKRTPMFLHAVNFNQQRFAPFSSRNLDRYFFSTLTTEEFNKLFLNSIAQHLWFIPLEMITHPRSAELTPQALLGGCVNVCDQNGPEELLMKILKKSNFPHLSQQEAAFILTKAASFGNFQLLQILSQMLRIELSSVMCEVCLVNAILRKNKESMVAILNDSRFSPLATNCSGVLYRAVEDLQIFLIIKNHPKFANITPTDLGRALENAASLGKMDIVANIMQDPRFEYIPKAQLGHTLFSAAQAGQLNAVKAIIACHRFSKITMNNLRTSLHVSQSEDCFVAIAAAIIFSPGGLKKISKMGEIGRTLINASFMGHLAVVKAIVSGRTLAKLSSRELGEALQRASSRGQLAVVHAIIACKGFNRIPLQVLIGILIDTTRTKRFDIRAAIDNSSRAAEFPREQILKALERSTKRTTARLLVASEF